MLQQPESNDVSRRRHGQRLDRLQRSRTWRGVFLPFSLMLTLLIVMIGIALSLRTAAQVAVLSDSMLTLLVLCPMVICMFPLVILMLILVTLAGRLQRISKSPLRRLESWTADMENHADRWLGRIDERTLQWAVNFAPFRRILGMFDVPSYESQDEKEP